MTKTKTWRIPRKDKKKVKQMFYERAKKRGFPCRTRKEKYWVLHSMLWNEPRFRCGGIVSSRLDEEGFILLPDGGLVPKRAICRDEIVLSDREVEHMREEFRKVCGMLKAQGIVIHEGNTKKQ